MILKASQLPRRQVPKCPVEGLRLYHGTRSESLELRDSPQTNNQSGIGLTPYIYRAAFFGPTILVVETKKAELQTHAMSPNCPWYDHGALVAKAADCEVVDVLFVSDLQQAIAKKGNNHESS